MSNIPTPVLATQSSVLQSWKEIAGYLGRGVRTVQRYENEFGLPVRRLDVKGRSAVMALKEDLDRWLRTTIIGDQPCEEPRNGPIVSQTRQSRFEHEHLRRETHILCLSHQDAALKLQSTLQKIIGQIGSAKADA